VLRMLKNGGFASFVEIIITAVIFILAAVGIMTTISAIRPQGGDSSRKLEALYAGKNVIEELRDYIDANTWDDAASNLATGVTRTRTVGDFTVNYILTDEPGLNIRKLTMNVTYPD
jgi:type II secretory pathway pseudopilin PulG